jgi:Putative peptidoglycan binding domain
MSSDDVKARRIPGAGYGGAPDSRQDDWLGDETAIEWFPGASETAERVARERRPRRRELSEPRAAVALTPEAERAQVFRRRRLGGLIAATVLVGAAIVAAVVLLSGGSSPAVQTTHAVTTAAVTTTKTATTPVTKKKVTKASTSTTATTPIHLVLPASGVLRQGDSGSAVKELQLALTKLGGDVGTTDGTFGQLTETAVATFQQANGLTADGIVGAATAAKINAALLALGTG